MLNKLASAIGKPMYTDAMTANKSRIEYARLLVEVDIREELQQVITIEGRNGNVWKQRIDYEWYPEYCKTCKTFTHTTSNCRRKPKQVWVAKQVQKDEVPLREPQEEKNQEMEANNVYQEGFQTATRTAKARSNKGKEIEGDINTFTLLSRYIEGKSSGNKDGRAYEMQNAARGDIQEGGSGRGTFKPP
jgi:hypothetical protein